jgi:hypothetical protein
MERREVGGLICRSLNRHSQRPSGDTTFHVRESPVIPEFGCRLSCPMKILLYMQIALSASPSSRYGPTYRSGGPGRR